MDPEDLREVISTYQKCVAETVRRFDRFVAKNMGDGRVLRQADYLQAKTVEIPSLFTNPRRCVNSRQKRKLAHGL